MKTTLTSRTFRALSYCLIVLSAIGWNATALRAQQATAPSTTVIRTTAGEVLFDMVVTDKKGRIIRDIQPNDIEVLDEGVPQKLRSMALVARSVHLSNADVAAAGLKGVNPANLPTFNLITFVFDHLGAEGQTASRKAAEQFVRTEMGPDDYASVYRSDLSLYALQPFTTDRDRLVKAIDVATGGSMAQFKEMSQSVADARQNADRAAAAVQNLGNGGPPSAASLNGLAAAKFAAITADTLEFTSRSESTDDSRRTLNHILGIIDALHDLPGRKAVLYFSQYLPVNSNTAFLYAAAVNAADRSNVSLYTIDPSGLNLETDNAQAVNTMNAAAGIGRSQANIGAVTGAQAANSEITEDIQYSSKRRMDGLAQSTGGFFTSSTNDLRGPMQRIGADIQSHYEIAYAPSSGFDGKFHAIEVRLKRPNLLVRARKGYIATSGDTTVAPAMTEVASFETPILSLMGKLPAPRDFQLKQAALVFPEDAAKPTVDLTVAFPLKDFTFTPPTADKVAAHFAVVVTVKDQNGAILRKFSQDSPVSGPSDLRLREFIFERQVQLPPGKYNMESAVYEPATKKATVSSVPLEVTAGAPDAPRLSSLVVINRVDPLKPGTNAALNPLDFEKVRIVPNLEDALVQTPNRELGLYFVTYVAKGQAAPAAQLTISQGGAPMGQAPIQLPAPDATGRIPYTANLPLASFPPGHYEAEIQITAGGHTVKQATPFDVVAAH